MVYDYLVRIRELIPPLALAHFVIAVIKDLEPRNFTKKSSSLNS